MLSFRVIYLFRGQHFLMLKYISDPNGFPLRQLATRLWSLSPAALSSPSLWTELWFAESERCGDSRGSSLEPGVLLKVF